MINAYWPMYKIRDTLSFKGTLIFSTDFGEMIRY